jgi:hypothetical protein
MGFVRQLILPRVAMPGRARLGKKEVFR